MTPQNSKKKYGPALKRKLYAVRIEMAVGVYDQVTAHKRLEAIERHLAIRQHVITVEMC